MRGPVPPIQVYIDVLLHRLGGIAGNHFNQPYRVTDRAWHLSESMGGYLCIAKDSVWGVVRVGRLCAYDVVKTATPTSTTTSDALAIEGTIFITFGLGGLPSLDCFVK